MVAGVSVESNQSKKTTEQRSCFTTISCKNIDMYYYFSFSNKKMLLVIFVLIFFLVAKDVRSTEASTRLNPNKRKQRHNKNSVEDVITSIDFNLENEIEKTSGKLHDDDIEGDEEEMNDYDLDYEGD